MTLDYVINNPDKLFSVKDVAELFSLSDGTVWNWINKQQIISQKVGGVYVFTGREIINYLDRQQNSGFRSIKSVLNEKTRYGEENK